jgi:hypothetical protein
MNSRWKYQLMTGTPWAVFMILFSLFALDDTPADVQVKTPLFWIKVVSYFVIGIFVLGYVSWRGKQKREGLKK